MVGAGEADEFGARVAGLGGVLVGHFQGYFHGRGAVSGVEDFAEFRPFPSGGNVDEGFGEFDAGLVGGTKEGGVVQSVELSFDGGIDVGVAVADGGDPEGRDAIEVTVAVDVDEPGTFSTSYDRGLVADPGGMLGERVPYRASVSFDPGGLVGGGGTYGVGTRHSQLL